MISYENSAGTTLVLDSGGYELHDNDIREFSWDYSMASSPDGLHSKVRQFSRTYEKKAVRFGVFGTSSEFKARMNALHALTEKDVLLNSSGKLWYNGQYLRCFVVGAKERKYSREGNYTEIELSVLAITPFWITETTTSFSPASTALTDALRYPARFPFRYGTGYSNQTLYNAHYAETPIKLVIYGACTDPEITIAGHVYGLTVTLLDGERVEIDQQAHTIMKIDSSGGEYNLFNYRDKDNDIFQNVPAGNSAVLFSNLTFDITLIQPRSTPKWV